MMLIRHLVIRSIRVINPLAAILLLLASCNGRAIPTPRMPPTRTPASASPTPSSGRLAASATQPARSNPTPTSLPPTQVISPDGAPVAPNPGLAAPTPAPDPLRFNFPTAGPEPVSAWRPPLYPTPWALAPYDHFYFARPIAADQINWPLWDYRYGGSVFGDIVHTGVDIDAPENTPVLAAGSGKVVWAGYGLYHGYYDTNDPYGIAVAIRQDFGYQDQALWSVYGHLNQVNVAKGERVEVGQVIGLVGQTGQVTGPHLHFEVRIGENGYFTTRNPELWIVPPQGWGVLAGRVMDTSGELMSAQEIILTNLATDQNWMAKTYGPAAVNSDPYYQENVAISDLPAGKYEVRIGYIGINYIQELEIRPGLVTYFSFQGRWGISTQMPPVPGSKETPYP